MGMFSFIKDKIKKVYTGFTRKISSIFSRERPDSEFLEELRSLLLLADTGVKTTNAIIEKLSAQIASENIKEMSVVKERLDAILLEILNKSDSEDGLPPVLLMVGVNGSGKTTFIGKLACKIKNKGCKVLLVAGDTFRAAACQQLAEWAERVGAEIFIGRDNQDPASVVFDACKKFKEECYDHIIIDTAGRLQTKVNLMKELKKIKNIIKRLLPDQDVSTWLTVDTMLGQNSLRQAEVFHEATELNGIVLTKFDGTGKGGIVFSIVDSFQLPIMYVTFGEGLEDIKAFDPEEYVSGLLNE